MTNPMTPGIAADRLSNEALAQNFADLHVPLEPHEVRVAADRCYFCYDAPCVTACPTDIDIPLFIRQISTDRSEAAAKTMALYLMFAIGFKGGVAVSKSGIDGHVLAAMAAGIALSFLLPIVAFGLLRVVSRLSAVEAAAAIRVAASACSVRSCFSSAARSTTADRAD